MLFNPTRRGRRKGEKATTFTCRGVQEEREGGKSVTILFAPSQTRRKGRGAIFQLCQVGRKREGGKLLSALEKSPGREPLPSNQGRGGKGEGYLLLSTTRRGGGKKRGEKSSFDTKNREKRRKKETVTGLINFRKKNIESYLMRLYEGGESRRGSPMINCYAISPEREKEKKKRLSSPRSTGGRGIFQRAAAPGRNQERKGERHVRRLSGSKEDRTLLEESLTLSSPFRNKEGGEGMKGGQ